MLKGVGFKLQVRADCRKEKSESAKLNWSRTGPNRLRTRPDRSRIIEKEILQNFKSGPSSQKQLGFHSNLSAYKKETLATFWRPFGRLVCYSLWDLRGFVPSNYTRIYWSKIYNQAVIEANCYYKDQQLNVIWNLWVGSQSHMCGCLCWCKSKKRRRLWIRSLHIVMLISYYVR